MVVPTAPLDVGLPYTLDVRMVAQYLSSSTQTVKRRIADGKLQAYKDGGYWKIKREWLLEYEASLTQMPHIEGGENLCHT